MLLAMDQTDQVEDNGHYLMSRPLDIEREEIPEAWEGQSRVQLLEKLEKLALEYGKSLQSQNKATSPTCPSISWRLSVLSHTIPTHLIPRVRTRRRREHVWRRLEMTSR